MRVRTSLPRRVCLSLCVWLGAAAISCGDDDSSHVTKPHPLDAGDDAGTLRDSGRPTMTGGRDAGKPIMQNVAGSAPQSGSGGSAEPAIPTCVDAVCAALSNACAIAQCNHVTDTCEMAARPDGTACGDPSDDRCTDPDTCMGGQCMPNHQAKGSVCGHQGESCHNADTCDGNGHCVGKGFVAEGTPCGDTSTSECDAADSCDAAGQCQSNHVAAGASCGDHGVACRVDDTCDGHGACQDNGVLTQGTSCNTRGLGITTCHPSADVCDATGNCLLGDRPDGTACNSPSDTECDDPDSCFRGLCVPNYAPLNAPCGSQSESQCDHADQCNGAGACLTRRENIGTPCGTQSDACILASACDSNGACAAGGPAAASTPCGSAIQNACTGPDSCDGAGHCQDNNAPVNTVCTSESRECRDADRCDAAGTCQVGALFPQGTACGDTSDSACNHPDSCNSSGSCLPNYAALGAACGDQGVACQNDDACNGSGTCIDNGPMLPCASAISGKVVGLDTQLGLSGVTVEDRATHVTAQTDGSGTFALTVPFNVPVELEYHALSGYWGQILVRTFSASDKNADMVLGHNAGVAGLAAGVSGLPALQTNLGIVRARFVGNAGTGGEGVSLGASSSPAFTRNGSNTWVTSGTLTSGGLPQLLFINTTVGTTTAAGSGNGSNSCTASPSSNVHVVAHTFTDITVDCQ